MNALLLAMQLTVSLAAGETLAVTCDGVLSGSIGSTAADLACTDVPPPPPAGIVVDHNSVALFEQIPASYLAASNGMRMLMRHASVGGNISSGLDCLRDNTSVNCRTGFTVPASQVPIVLHPEYDRTNWTWEYRGNPGWYGKVTDFVNQVPRAGSFELLSYMHDYVDDPSGSNPITNFWDRAKPVSIDEVESVEATGKVIVYWTASIAKIAQPVIASWNDTMRAYVATRGVVFFDFADIVSHDLNGAECMASGVPAICGIYASEPAGGHLSNGMAQIRVAKAWRVLMAQIAGWRPN